MSDKSESRQGVDAEKIKAYADQSPETNSGKEASKDSAKKPEKKSGKKGNRKAENKVAAKLEAAEKTASENYDRFLRVSAEFENYKKRKDREIVDFRKYANEALVKELLPVVDNLERAIEHAATQEDGAGLLEGVEMTLSQFSTVIQKFGVEPLSSLGTLFDPAHHQAVGQLETDEFPANHVANELQKGYLLNSRLLRPAMVMVAKASQPVTEDNDTPAPTEDSGE
jgi:molecular chaperone GrpE